MSTLPLRIDPALQTLRQIVRARHRAVCSVDRLGRSLTDLLSFLDEIHSQGCDLYLHQQDPDTNTPAGRAMFQMMGMFAEFEGAIIREHFVSGLARAKAEGKASEIVITANG